jgi:hypothetical protein
MNNDVNALPEGFDGVFRFTNFTEEDFKARWNSIEYTFPAQKTIPMIIPGATPEEVQVIRKKFARELGEREFYKTPKFQSMNNIPIGQNPALYTESDLTPFIQRCLEPLPMAQATLKTLPKDKDSNYKSKVVQQGERLTDNDSAVIS